MLSAVLKVKTCISSRLLRDIALDRASDALFGVYEGRLAGRCEIILIFFSSKHHVLPIIRA